MTFQHAASQRLQNFASVVEHYLLLLTNTGAEYTHPLTHTHSMLSFPTQEEEDWPRPRTEPDEATGLQIACHYITSLLSGFTEEVCGFPNFKQMIGCSLFPTYPQVIWYH